MDIKIYLLICSFRFKQAELKSIVAVLYLFVNHQFAPILCIINVKCSLHATTTNLISKPVIHHRNLLNLAQIIKIPRHHLIINALTLDLLNLTRSIVLHQLIHRNQMVDKFLAQQQVKSCHQDLITLPVILVTNL